MTLNDTISVRRTVRKFDKTPLETKVLSEIKKVVADTKQLIGQNARFEFVQADDVKGGSAPHYILAFCDKSDANYANVGYVLQKADLHIQSIGLGSAWLGSVKPKAKRNDFCIALAFGKTEVPVRISESEFKRLKLSDISPVENGIARAARLAPSAMNSQPWKLRFEEGKVIVQLSPRGAMRLILGTKLNKVDLGIVTRHVEVALRNEGKRIKSIITSPSGKDLQIEVSYK
ncbi:MAG: hypothetical protein LBU32_31755 [Clostridiales bacterium]|jgi:molybdopterin-binding protein|nr:hypothetical protein [Clostridiales bacterium]